MRKYNAVIVSRTRDEDSAINDKINEIVKENKGELVANDFYGVRKFPKGRKFYGEKYDIVYGVFRVVSIRIPQDKYEYFKKTIKDMNPLEFASLEIGE